MKTGNDPTTRSYKNDLFTNESCDHRQNDLPVSELKNTLVLCSFTSSISSLQNIQDRDEGQ